MNALVELESDPSWAGTKKVYYRIEPTARVFIGQYCDSEARATGIAIALRALARDVAGGRIPTGESNTFTICVVEVQK